MSDLLISKHQIVMRCIKRARGAWQKPSSLPFTDDYDKQDIIILNLQRACERSLDMANHVVRIKKLGWPTSSSDSFSLLRQADIINDAMEEDMKKMISFRNTLVHRYQKIDLDIVQAVVEKDAEHILAFASLLARVD